MKITMNMSEKEASKMIEVMQEIDTTGTMTEDALSHKVHIKLGKVITMDYDKGNYDIEIGEGIVLFFLRKYSSIIKTVKNIINLFKDFYTDMVTEFVEFISDDEPEITIDGMDMEEFIDNQMKNEESKSDYDEKEDEGVPETKKYVDPIYTQEELDLLMSEMYGNPDPDDMEGQMLHYYSCIIGTLEEGYDMTINAAVLHPMKKDREDDPYARLSDENGIYRDAMVIFRDDNIEVCMVRKFVAVHYDSDINVVARDIANAMKK